MASERAPLVVDGSANVEKDDDATAIEMAAALEKARRKKNGLLAILGVMVVLLLAVILVLASEDAMGSPHVPASETDADRLAKDVRDAMDVDAKPCKDFYQFACGGWLEENEIPDDQSSWGRSFSVLHKRNLHEMQELLEDDHDSLVGKFYQSCMNLDEIEKKGLEPLKPLLKMVDEALDATDSPDTADTLPQRAMKLSAELSVKGVGSLLSIGVDTDLKDPTKHTLNLGQGGMGLPDKTYYFEAEQEKIRTQYVAHVTNMLALGDPDNTIGNHTVLAKGIMALETKLAEKAMTRTEMRDVDKLYNNMTLQHLTTQVPNLPWEHYLKTFLQDQYSGFGPTMELNVESKDFIMEGLEAALSDAAPAGGSAEVLKAYFKYRCLHSYATFMGKAYRDEQFDFYAMKLRGQLKELPRDEKCVTVTDAYLSDLTGPLYTKAHFDKHAKKEALSLISGVSEAFKINLENNVNWMDAKTKEAATAKLNKVEHMIGYPDNWEIYEDFEPEQDTYFENAQWVREFELTKDIKDLSKPVDRTKWEMSAATVNAYYDPNKNQMVFPAGILQNPFFGSMNPPALNYGAMGAVMGHELTHGFDDEGRKFDGQGRLVDWWSQESATKFDKNARCVATQFDTYVVGTGQDPTQGAVHVNGNLTLGENIADLGGLKASYDAFQTHKQSRTQLRRNFDYPPPFKALRLTEDQLFFVAYAQSWCEKVRHESELTRVKTDPHSPPQFRVQGPLTNLQEFRDTFGCTPGTDYYKPDDQICKVW